MTCEGCTSTISRVLGKIEGIDNFEVDLANKKVTVNGNVETDKVLQALQKWGDARGKAVSLA